MSAETKEALEQAIRAHVAEEMEGRMLTDWVLQTACVGVSMNRTGYMGVFSDSPMHTCLGLATMIADDPRKSAANDYD